MAIDFPASPTTGQTFTSGSLVYTYDGTKWTAEPAGVTGGTKIEVSNTKAEIIDTGSDGRFVVTTEGSERLRVDSNGRVGIGTTSPSQRLHVLDDANNVFLQVEATGTAKYAQINLRGTSTANYISSDDDLAFYVNAGERARIDSSGRLLVGTSTATATPLLGVTGSLTANNGIVIKNSVAHSGSPIFIYFINSADGVSGSITQSGSTSVAYNTTSDYRLKENVVPLTGAIERLNLLQIHRFNFIGEPDRTVDGFIAHEAQAVVPECVTGTKDEVDADGNPKYQGIDQSKLVPLLTAALQEAIERIETLEAEVAALKAS